MAQSDPGVARLHSLEQQRRAATNAQAPKVDDSDKTPEERLDQAQPATPPSETPPKVVQGPTPRPRPSAVDTIVNPTRGAAFEVQSNVNATRYLKALIYSEYGVGKTHLAGTSVEVPQMRDVLFVSAEAGTLTLFDPDSSIPFHLIDIIEVQDYKTTGRVYDFLKLHCSVRERAAAGDEEAKTNLMKLQKALMPRVPDPDRLRLYRTVVIDSLTEVESMCMAQLLGITPDTLMDEETSSETWDEYRNQRKMIHRLIRNFRNLPMNSIFTCPRYFREVQDGTKKTQRYMPMMTGKLSHEVQGFMDLVGHYIAGTPQTTEGPEGQEVEDSYIPRRMYIQPGPRHAAKSRFSRYRKPYFDNPSMLSIMRNVGLLEEPPKNSDRAT